MICTESQLRKMIRETILNELWRPPPTLGDGEEKDSSLGFFSTIRRGDGGHEIDTGWGDGEFYGEADYEVDEVEDDGIERPEADDLIGGYREEEIEDRMTNRQQALGQHMQQLEIPLYQF